MPKGQAKPNETNHLLWDLLQRLAELINENSESLGKSTLGEILAGADQYDGQLEVVACLIRDAVINKNGGWQLSTPLGTPQLSTAVHASTPPPKTDPESKIQAARSTTFKLPGSDPASNQEHVTENDAARARWVRNLLHDVHEALITAYTPLSTQEITERMGRKIHLRTLRRELDNDPRFIAIEHDRWSLAEVPLISSESVDRRLDSLVNTLKQADRPMSTQELRQEGQFSINITYFKQKLDGDPRFHRCEKNKWALTEWGMPVYKPMKQLVAELVDDHDGSIPANKIIASLCRDFGFKETSLRQVMSSAPFTTRNGVVYRRADIEVIEHTSHSTADQNDAPSADDLLKSMGLS
ncbi:hypothetical protein [Nocardiopsis sp. FIRDI 009]|uniref:hypothetical protein n=1 Tax=Nocardiopsis sp. FIRDI 009 TaxID=714197 RepID=UPI0013006F7F|nr:hypothetical protein [Nocardiopsis sp. FIRDI 009]